MAPKTKTSSTELQRTDRKTASLVAAFQDVTDGVVDLAKTHLELAQAEARRDFGLFAKYAFIGAAGGAAIVVGILLLNLVFILLCGWAGAVFIGTWQAAVGTMAVSAVLLAAAELGGGYMMIKFASKHMESLKQAGRLNATKTEIQRSQEWVKEIRESS